MSPEGATVPWKTATPVGSSSRSSRIKVLSPVRRSRFRIRAPGSSVSTTTSPRPSGAHLSRRPASGGPGSGRPSCPSDSKRKSALSASRFPTQDRPSGLGTPAPNPSGVAGRGTAPSATIQRRGGRFGWRPATSSLSPEGNQRASWHSISPE